MEFVLLLTVSFIPLFISVSILFYSKTSLTKALSIFLLLLSFWQMDIAFLYAEQFLSLQVIDLLFRILRMGPIFIMPTMYYFSYYLVKENPFLHRFGIMFNKSGMCLVMMISIITYLINFTSLGVESYRFVEAGDISPAHWIPIYGPLNFTFIINVLLVFINWFFLFIVTLHLKGVYYRSFYLQLVIAAMIIFINGVISGFSFAPLYFSSFNSIIAALILFLGFFQMQSQRIRNINIELIKQSELLEEIMDINPNYLLVTGSDQRIVKVNRSFCQLFNEREHTLLGKKISTLIHFLPMIAYGFEQPYRYTDYKGKNYYIQWGMKQLYQNSGQSFTIFFGNDVTEQKKNEQLLLSSEKMKVIGEMAAGVAHEIRNPLTTIRGFIQLLRERNPDSTYERILIEEIDRINQVLKELLILGKPEAKSDELASVEPFDAVDEVKNINLLFNAMATEEGKKIQLTNKLMQKQNIMMDKSHFKQVMINIIKNSLEAIREGGKVKIVLDEHKEYIRIRVMDNGEGISKERLARIGEPYFTSKEKGNGIGLTICFKIMSENKGKMFVKSKERYGTVVTMLYKAN
ncbi:MULTISPECIES: ATP-binding protein [Cytobacillus]|uniref:histidine kinase n=1 Tax=Cytobacillus stercorigallinarum TaxID=2762240 RepID=A0ABR8QPF5_9BACI|nr:ATP-binding protein [Cytobacillus stercorigallinarum]MBD7937421.1 ATP-binding protein [Cytobacillus stercorigallinarum]